MKTSKTTNESHSIISKKQNLSGKSLFASSSSSSSLKNLTLLLFSFVFSNTIPAFTYIYSLIVVYKHTNRKYRKNPLPKLLEKEKEYEFMLYFGYKFFPKIISLSLSLPPQLLQNTLIEILQNRKYEKFQIYSFFYSLSQID